MPALSPVSVVQSVGVWRVFHWLRLGWRDLFRAAPVSLLQGLLIALIGGLQAYLLREDFWLLAGMVSGFMLIAPVLATSFYALSQAIASGETADFAVVRRAWTSWQQREVTDRNYWRMILFGLLLALATVGWILTSAALITIYAPSPIHSPSDFVTHVLLANEGALFELWMLMGGILAAPIFASSVISMPLLLDKPIRLREAVLLSWQCVLINPMAMVAWAVTILILMALGFATLMVGLIVIVPWLGHASWHVYDDLLNGDSRAAEMTDS